MNVDAGNFCFVNVRWYGLPGGPEGTLEDEIQALESQSVEFPNELLAKTCKDLCGNYEDKREYLLAGEFHYWSMEALRKVGWRQLGLVAFLYWVMSGYGERPRRALWILVAICAVFAALYMLLGPNQLSILSTSGIWQSAGHAGQAVVYSLGVMTRLSPEPKPDPGHFQFLVSIEGILGPSAAGAARAGYQA